MPALANGQASRQLQSQSSACILCSLNCGIELEVRDGHLEHIRGDKAHPASQGYTCQKALRLDYYQNSASRITDPLRRRPDGSFEVVSWETAIREIAAKMKELKLHHGGEAFAYYGGGGQGNHLGGSHAGSLRAALGTRYVYSALAQEKTGGFWVDGKLFGKQFCHPTEDVEHADFLLVIGANPWQSHGFPRARQIIQELSSNPAKTLVVVDPRRTETAKKADYHLAVRPGGDAHLLLAMLGCLVQEDLVDHAFLDAHTVGFERLAPVLRGIDVDGYCRHAGLEPPLVREITRKYAGTPRATVRTDLGLEHTPHSTLNTYLAKLLFLLTGHFGKPGTNVLHTALAPLIAHSEDPDRGGRTTRVTGVQEIAGLYPPNVLPKEIDTDHPQRVRAVVVESGNPMLTGADTQAYQRAFSQLELLVVIDVAMTETARYAHYVLPAATQFEKYEATFFNLEFPENYFHLRRPVLKPAGNSLPEPEIHRRLVVELGEFPRRFPILTALARLDRRAPRLRIFPTALLASLKLRPKLARHLPLLLHETLGKALPKGASAAGAIWGLCQRFVRMYGDDCVRRAGIVDQGAGYAEALFQKILESPSGTLISVHDYDATWSMIKHPDQKIHLAIERLICEIESLPPPRLDPAFPLLLQAGERRSYNANSIYRERDWRKSDPDGALRIHPRDAHALGLEEGQLVWCESSRAAVAASANLTDEVCPGMVSLPHGYGMFSGNRRQDESQGRNGPPINFLTDSDYCDELSKVPFHKHVPVRVVPVGPGDSVLVGEVRQPLVASPAGA